MKFIDLLDEDVNHIGLSGPGGLNDHKHEIFVNEFGDGFTSFDEQHTHIVIAGKIKEMNGHEHSNPGWGKTDLNA